MRSVLLRTWPLCPVTTKFIKETTRNVLERFRWISSRLRKDQVCVFEAVKWNFSKLSSSTVKLRRLNGYYNNS